MTQNMDNKPQVKRESKNKIRVEFERTDLKERLKAKYLSAYFLKNVVWYIFRLLLLIGIAFVVLKPFYTIIMQSFMAAEDFIDSTVVQVPRHFSAIIYKAIIVDLEYFNFFFQTLALSLGCALLQTFSCALIGYGLAKFKFRGAKAVFFLVVLTLAIPHGTMQSAIFYRFRHFDILGILTFFSGGARTGIGWLDGILSKITILPFIDGVSTIRSVVPLLLLSATGLAFKNGLYIFMLRQFFRGVPDELEESAYLDGANTFRTFLQVILPLSVPMMITVFLFAFCWQWTDDFYIPLFFTGDQPSLMTYIARFGEIPKSLTVLYTNVTHSSGDYKKAIEYGCGLMACAPLIILYLFCQKFLVQGIERSGITG
ncbi:MAG: carbohydrate ABC transporter permease [Ruminococcaceae bacterium]|nr:carbohydrate ABC transporter permease [Oscillospiraceae bacterium]